MTTRPCKKLTIFEGPDGGGKSTAARKYAEETGALLVHHGPYPELSGPELAWKYLDSMVPALTGERDVVLDRCWLSEPIYGQAFRGGADRLGAELTRMLERAALRAETAVIMCLPPWTVCHENYLSRRELEYLENSHQLATVFSLYEATCSLLPKTMHDYTSGRPCNFDQACRSQPHEVRNLTCGWMSVENTVLVGEAFGRFKPSDHPYQLPFVSFSRSGCSFWLASQLELAGVSESMLVWTNSDQDLTWLEDWHGLVVALGNRAHNALADLGVGHARVPHPRAWKRFHSRLTYPLIPLLKGVA